MEMPKGPFCQSCAMPLENEDQHGTEVDGSRSAEYCTYCYQGGKFTEPDITMDEMISKVVGLMVSMMGMEEDQAKGMIGGFIPTLKRWKA